MSCRALLFIFLLPVLLSAQTVVSVDSDITRNSGKSMPLALGASAILPGMGELYLGESSYTRPFVWVDASLWMTTIVSYIVGERYITSAHNYASRYAGLNTSSTKREGLRLPHCRNSAKSNFSRYFFVVIFYVDAVYIFFEHRNGNKISAVLEKDR